MFPSPFAANVIKDYVNKFLALINTTTTITHSKTFNNYITLFVGPFPNYRNQCTTRFNGSFYTTFNINFVTPYNSTNFVQCEYLCTGIDEKNKHFFFSSKPKL